MDKLFKDIPYKKLGFFPTPFHKLDKTSKKYNIDLYIKRDDLTGPTVFGGNKIRKLEFLFGDAIEKNCSHVFTYGASQSNHAMQTVTAANILGLKAELFLLALVEPKEDDIRSNLLLNQILGAKTHLISLNGGSEKEASKKSYILGKQRKEELENAGYKVYNIPVGGSTSIGALGLVKAMMEIPKQMDDEKEFDFIFSSTGSGGTLAGIYAGTKILNWKTKLVAISAIPKDDTYSDTIIDLSQGALDLLGLDRQLNKDDFKIDLSYIGKGYEIPSEESTQAIKYFARKEGIFFDPIYTGKAAAGLLDYIEKGLIPPKSKVLFYHTGGGTGLFAEKDIVGDFS